MNLAAVLMKINSNINKPLDKLITEQDPAIAKAKLNAQIMGNRSRQTGVKDLTKNGSDDFNDKEILSVTGSGIFHFAIAQPASTSGGGKAVSIEVDGIPHGVANWTADTRPTGICDSDYLSYLDSSGYIININGYLINRITPIVCGLSLFSTLGTNGGVIDVRGGIYFDKSLKILARSMDTNIKVAYCYDLL